MSDVFFASGGIGVSCPGGVVTLNQNVFISGDFSYKIVNKGDQDALVNVVATLSDSAGHQVRFSQQLIAVPANGSFADQQTLVLAASYDLAGIVDVVMRAEFSGALTDSKSAVCGFPVTGNGGTG